MLSCSNSVQEQVSVVQLHGVLIRTCVGTTATAPGGGLDLNQMVAQVALGFEQVSLMKHHKTSSNS